MTIRKRRLEGCVILPRRSSVNLFKYDTTYWLNVHSIVSFYSIYTLQLTRDEKLSLELKAKENNEKLSVQVERHITTLKKLKCKLEDRAEVKSRNDEFKEWKRTFAAKKEAILYGQTLRPSNASAHCAEIRVDGEESEEEEEDNYSVSSLLRSKPKQQKKEKELNLVLASLNKLSALENRVRGLETHNRHNDRRQAVTLPPNRKAAFLTETAVSSRPDPAKKETKR